MVFLFPVGCCFPWYEIGVVNGNFFFCVGVNVVVYGSHVSSGMGPMGFYLTEKNKSSPGTEKKEQTQTTNTTTRLIYITNRCCTLLRLGVTLIASRKGVATPNQL